MHVWFKRYLIFSNVFRMVAAAPVVASYEIKPVDRRRNRRPK